MAKVDLYPDFREFLKSLNSAGIRYLVLGGYAVIHYGYRRATDDLDVWIAIDPDNASKVSRVVQDFWGLQPKAVTPALFQQRGKIFIFGREPVRIDLLTSPDALDFEACYARRNVVTWDGVKVPLLSFDDLKRNKSASGRNKDLADLDNLPPVSPWKRPKPKRRRPGRRTK